VLYITVFQYKRIKQQTIYLEFKYIVNKYECKVKLQQLLIYAYISITNKYELKAATNMVMITQVKSALMRLLVTVLAIWSLQKWFFKRRWI